MKKDFYNSKDEEYEHVLKLLKELPREKAPDNFEYNLKVRIENKNFGNAEKRFLFFPKILLPATGAVFAALILFFTFFNEQEEQENPFQILPQTRSSITQPITKNVRTKFFSLKRERITPNDVIIKPEETELKNENNIVNAKKVIAKNTKEKSDFPFEDYEDTNLDEILKEKRNQTNINSRATLTGATNSPSTFFDGFHIREEVDAKYVEALKARLDSLKKSVKKNHIK
ncbi:MAG: hypothetical protein CR986_03950 [Ignavibacteriae bacterium]|nr:MAG: hypothetical protein CR986_03950 [Ignavibacteriota bacterium]